MNKMKSLLVLIPVLFLFFSNSAFAQTKEQREVIKQSMGSEDSIKAVAEIEKYTTQRKERIEKFLADNPNEKRQFVKKGKVYVLYNVTNSGKPIYYTLKKVSRKNTRESKKCFKKD